MFWADQIAAESSDRTHIVNDSKTPSGRVHVGSLRGERSRKLGKLVMYSVNGRRGKVK